MRLIDADNIFFYCNYQGDCTADIENCKECENYVCDFRDIQEQQTAYDIDKVIDELNDALYDNPYSFSEIESNNAFKKSIEIVKQECIGEDTIENDICEWRYRNKQDLYPYTTSCGSCFEFDADFIYCPKCSKKIKAIIKDNDDSTYGELAKVVSNQ